MTLHLAGTLSQCSPEHVDVQVHAQLNCHIKSSGTTYFGKITGVSRMKTCIWRAIGANHCDFNSCGHVYAAFLLWNGLGSPDNWAVLVCVLISKQRLCGADRPAAFCTDISVIANL